MAARIISYWSLMGLSVQTARWEKSMTLNLIEMGEAMERSAALQVAAAEENSIAAETLEQAEIENGQAIELEQEASLLLEQSEANAGLAAKDEAKVEEMESEISSLESEAAGHAAMAAADEALAEKESAQAMADTIDATRIESQARGEEIGIAFCELIPLLDVACDVVGGVTAVGLETGAATEAVKAAGEWTAAGTTKVEEEREVALATESEASLAAEQGTMIEIEADAAENVELAQEEQKLAEAKEVEASSLSEKSEIDKGLSVEEEAAGASDEAESDSQATIAIEKGVAASWNAMLATGCGLLSISFLFLRTIRRIILPMIFWVCSRGDKNTMSQASPCHPFASVSCASYVFHHCAIFIVVGVSFQALFNELNDVSLKARGGVILGFAYTAGFLQSVALHIIPNGLAKVERTWQLAAHFVRRMIVLPILFTVEMLIIWVVFGPDKYATVNFSRFLVLILWATLSAAFALHIILLELPRLKGYGNREPTMSLVEIKDPANDSEKEQQYSTETAFLISNKSGNGVNVPNENLISPSWFNSLMGDMSTLQIPIEILVLACLSSIVFHSMTSLRVIWPIARPMLIQSRPKWTVPIVVAAVSFFIFLCSFSMFYENYGKTKATNRINNAGRRCGSRQLIPFVVFLFSIEQ